MKIACAAYIPSENDPSSGLIEVLTVSSGLPDSRFHLQVTNGAISAEAIQPSPAIWLTECRFICISGRRSQDTIASILQETGIRTRIRWLPLKELERTVTSIIKSKLRTTRTGTNTTNHITGQLFSKYCSISDQLPENYRQIIESTRDEILPPRLDAYIRTEIPDTPGVYYFLDRNKRPLYIGKAHSLRKRIISHFSSNEDILKLIRLQCDLSDIQYEETGSALLAGLLEDHEIRHYWPPMNKAQKTKNDRFAVVYYRNRREGERLRISRTNRHLDPIAHFHAYHHAVSFLHQLAEKYEINPDISGIAGLSSDQKQRKRSTFSAFLKEYHHKRKLTIYFTEGRNLTEHGYVAFENATYIGYGFVEKAQEPFNEKTDFLRFLKRCKSSATTEKLLKASFEERSPDLVINLKKGAIPSGTAPRFARALTFDFPQ